MAQYEIERKWSVSFDGAYPQVNLELKEDHPVYQWYIVADKMSQVRISQRLEDDGERYTLNIKTGNGLKRHEARIDITYKEFKTLTGQCEDAKPITKHLYAYYLPGGKILELSHVDNEWWYIEVEFENEQEAKDFDITPYLHEGTRVTDETGNPEYAMKNYWRRTRLNEEV